MYLHTASESILTQWDPNAEMDIYGNVQIFVKGLCVYKISLATAACKLNEAPKFDDSEAEKYLRINSPHYDTDNEIEFINDHPQLLPMHEENYGKIDGEDFEDTLPLSLLFAEADDDKLPLS
ncbi:hypothetical protein MRB53_026169 [Persea americana]|uniref:Uncharacterized protein n=1 Tax=Persea americana TaxID=3435 RepID=A0ACC2LI86_PERAE|nr:hypothetical protein MRB53_026169 [Persea americana]